MKHKLAHAFTGSHKTGPSDVRPAGEQVHVHKKHLDTPHTIKEIDALATLIRKHIVLMLLEAGSGHSAGALGMADFFAALYFSVLKHDPLKPNWEERDRLILSNGHTCPVLYATLAEAGYFSKTHLKTLRKLGSQLQGHPHHLAHANKPSIHTNTFWKDWMHEVAGISHPENVPGVENTSGPLGQGLSQAIGIATALKLNKQKSHVYCIMSDGELQEGQNWEAFLYAGSKTLNNLIVIIDRNEIQIDGYTEQVLPLNQVHTKLESMNWNTYSIDGHNVESIIQTCEQAKNHRLGPSAIICNTTPGKDIDFMEDLPEWHGKPPTKKEAKDALDDLRSLKGRIWWE